MVPEKRMAAIKTNLQSSQRLLKSTNHDMIGWVLTVHMTNMYDCAQQQ